MDVQRGATGTPDFPPDVSIRPWLAVFADPDVEGAYRRDTCREEARRLRVTLLFGAAAVPVLALPDLVRSGLGGEHGFLLSTELLVMVVCLGYASRLRRRPELVLDRRVVAAVEVLTVAALLALAMIAVTGGGSPEPRAVVAPGLLVAMGVGLGRTVSRGRREEHGRLLMERWSNSRLVAEIGRRREVEEELLWRAHHDTLTDLLNRRSFLEESERELVRARRVGRPASVLVMDADHFKSINDRFGHHTGDAAIRAIGQCCRAHLRDNDLVARIGGEEFAVLLPDTDFGAALDVAAGLRREVAETTLDHRLGEVAMTVSVGVVECRTWSETVPDALRRADLAMYEAKAAGRNRVVGLRAGELVPVP